MRLERWNEMEHRVELGSWGVAVAVAVVAIVAENFCIIPTLEHGKMELGILRLIHGI